MITSAELVAFVRDKIGCGYVFGSTGELITEAFIQAKAAQYKEMYTAGYIQSSRKWIGHIAYDCSGLIRKATGTSTNAHGYYSRATESGKIGTMPEMPGVLVFMARRDGTMYHVGVYVGNGKVIEAKGVAYGVVETTGRNWSHWGKCHAVEYKEESDVIQKGNNGAAVKSWQEVLLKFGFELPKYGADSDFGGETETATKNFQARFSLPQTGIVDAATAAKAWDALRLIPNVDVKPYSDEIARLKLILNTTISENASLKVINDDAIGDLKTLAKIIRKYEV